MERFCESPFWDLNTTWNTQDPDFTECFEKSILLLIPCGFLWITAIFDFYFNTNSLDVPPWRPQWTRLSVFKVFNITLLTCLTVTILCTNWLEHVDDGEMNIFSMPIVLWTHPMALITTHFLSAMLVVLHKNRCVHTSGIQLIHWSLLSVVQATIFRTYLKKYMEGSESYLCLVLLGISCSVMVIQTLCFFWSDIPASDGNDHSPLNDMSGVAQIPECPLVRASFLSQIMFSWVFPIVKKSNNSVLKFDDLWGLGTSYQTIPVMKVFEKNSKMPTNNKRPRGVWKNIISPILRTCGRALTIGFVCRFVSCILAFVSPKIMGRMIVFVEDENIEEWKGYMWAMLLLTNHLLITFLEEQYLFYLFKCYANCMSCIDLKIYKKALSISYESRKDTTSGEIANLMNIDAEKIRLFLYVSDTLWTSPVQVTLGILLLYYELGMAIFAGVGILCSVIPVNWILTTFKAKYQRAQLEKKDERIKILSEVLSGINVVKLYAWETSFEIQIQKVRSEEIRILRKIAAVQCLINLVFDSLPFFVTLASFMTYVYMDKNSVLDPQRAFTALSLFSVLTGPITSLPRFVSSAVNASVSLKRVNKFFNAEEIDPNATSFEEKSDLLPAVEIKDGYFSWESESKCLKDINISVKLNTLTAVVGQVASGKSSLLTAILGEMKYSGETTVRGSVAYVPQVAWIINGTLRENICFGLPYKKDKYDRIIGVCCLDPDIEILPAGDMTEIGEKGINLSGGQRQRVSLARAVYSDADVFLLDDVLSAVDSNVGKQIFNNLLGKKGLLANKTRILCTHAYSFLSQVDNIIVMNNGTIVETGPFDKLQNKSKHFAQLTSQCKHSLSNDNSEDSVQKLNPLKSHKVNQRNQQSGKLIEEENLQTGHVKLSVMVAYIRSMGFTLFSGFLLSFATTQGLGVWQRFTLGKWSENNQTRTGVPTHTYMIQYTVLGLAGCLSDLIGFILLSIAALCASKKLHNDMLTRILRAPVTRFFNVTLLGRIVNRFSSDVELVDCELPDYFGDNIIYSFQFVAVLVAISLTNVYFLCLIIPLFFIYLYLQRYYIICMEQLQRIMSARKSPIFAQFSETLNGTSSIRSYKAQERFINLMADKLDSYNRVNFPHLVVRRWLSILLSLLGGLIVCFPAVSAVIWRGTISSSLIGLAITYALTATSTLSWFMKTMSYVQYDFVSVERILEYTAVDQESDWENPNNAISPLWPDKGGIEFKRYETRYRSGLDLVLKNFTCKILPGEKIGIVGRTGAGKSSLTLALFRIMEATSGEILIDGANISLLGVHDLRKRLTVIPQDPVLFSMTLRFNLDPFEEHNDDQIWKALELAHLKPYIESLHEGLNYQIAEAGDNLSVGQRQLVCLARAILRKSKILILDEATASVDPNTDELIQETIRSTFESCTILNVAHRLTSVLDSSRIMVMRRGEIIEFDTPSNLLSNPESDFYGMAKDAGIL